MSAAKKSSPSKMDDSEMPPAKKHASMTEATDLLATGKRHLLVAAVPAAVSDLAECCELLAKQYGETAAECAEAYYYYGKALLEMSRMESGVLGNALTGVDIEAEDKAEGEQVEDTEKMTKDEKLEVEEKVADALEENFEKHDKVAKIHDGEIEESEEESGMESQDESEKEKTEKTEEKEDEEPGNLQLAWEMEELAKLIYTRSVAAASGEKKASMTARLCDTYLTLGEVSMEGENYTLAVADIAVCLDMRKKSLPADSRSIAETSYQLGVAQAFAGSYAEAEASLAAAIAVLQTRVKNLGKMEASENITKEIADLETLVTEIKEKIADHKNMKEETLRIGKEAGAGFTGVGGKAATTIGVKKAGSTTVGSA